jgi:uncharacterized protein (DUF983 family)
MKATWTFSSLLGLRCPVCGADSFKAGWYKSAKACAQCGQNFEPEQGFFAGAIYPMYGMGAVVAGGTGLLVALGGGSFAAMLIAAGVALLACSPWIFWYARLGFLHTNHRFFGDQH